jgi:hypothetical protein
MPRADWELDAGDIDDWDRSNQRTPYTGKVPPNAVYLWEIFHMSQKPATKGTKPRINVGLRLVPRDDDEQRYAGYVAWKNTAVTGKSQPFYVPLLDALGVSEDDFRRKTILDSEGNIKRIGPWINDGKTEVLGQLEDNNWVDQKTGQERTGKAVGWCGAPEDSDYDSDDPDDDDEDF